MELAPGTLVTPNVRLRRPLREGGMGHVWLAEHLTLKLDVAVKFISRKLATDDPQVLARFEQEARTAAHIKSDHVVQTHDCGIMPDGTPYIVMELLEGESLQDHLDRAGTLSLRDLGRVVAHVAKALGRAHKIGVVHRDIKPANIFLCTTDEGLHVKVLDFGVAQPLTHDPRTGQPLGPIDPVVSAGGPEQLVGTLPFLAPEQFSGQGPVDHHVDLWALGIVAYRCLTGRFPFTGQTPGLLCVSVMSGEFPRPTALRAQIPVGLDEWFAHVLHRMPSERFASAKDMAWALARVIPSTAEDFDEEHSTIVYPGSPPARGSVPGPRGSVPGARGSAPGQQAMLESGPSLVMASAPAPLGHRWVQPMAIAGVAVTILVLGAAGLVLLRGPAASHDAGVGASATASSGRATASGATTDEENSSEIDAGTDEAAASARASVAVDGGPPPAATRGGPIPGKGWPTGKRRKGREDYGF